MANGTLPTPVPLSTSALPSPIPLTDDSTLSVSQSGRSELPSPTPVTTTLQPPEPLSVEAASNQSIWNKIRAAVDGPGTFFGTSVPGDTWGNLVRHPIDYAEHVLPSIQSLASKPTVNVSQFEKPTGVAGEVGKATTAVAEGMTSPESIAMIGGTKMLGLLGKAGSAAQRLLGAGFGGSMIYNAYQHSAPFKEAVDKNDYPKAAYHLTHILLSGGLGALGVREAALGGTSVPGKEIPSSENTPISKVVSSPAKPPEVRVVDDAPSMRALEDAQTIVAPKTGPQPTARVVSGDHVPTVAKSEILNETVQQIIANSHEMEKAGLDPTKIKSREDVEEMLDSAADHIKQNLDPRVGNVISLDAQKALASDLGMTTADLLSRSKSQAFNAETAIAARSLLKDSQSNVLSLARKAATDDSFRKATLDALAQHKEILNQVAGMTSEAGRALGSFRVGEDELPEIKAANLIANLSEGAKDQAIKALGKLDPNNPRQLNNFVSQFTPSTTADKVFEYYRNALLSSPKTVIVKGASEAAMMALETTKKAVAGGLAKAKSLVTGNDPNVFPSESYWFAKGASQALRHASDILKGTFTLEDMPEFERTRRQAIKGGLGKVVRLPSEILSRQTNLMYALNYFGELNSQAARQAIKEGLSGQELYARQQYLANNPTPEMRSAANEMGLHNTFQSELGKFGAGVQKTISDAPGNIGKFLFPFFRTPINLVKATGEYSPYGLLKGGLKGDLDTIARGFVGSSIASAIAAATLDGHITGGGPLDYRKREALQDTGWQPYSIRIGNRYYSYHRLEPVGLAMGMIADAIHGAQSGDDPETTQSKADTAVAHIARNVDDFPFVTTLANLTESLHGDPEKKIQNFIAHQVAGFVPAGLSNIAQATDPTYRQPEGILQTVETRIPGLTGNVPAEIDVSGKPATRPASSVGGGNPFPISSERGDPVISELARLGETVERPPATVSESRKGLHLKRGQKVLKETASDDEARRIQEEDQQRLYSFLATRVGSDSWRRMPDDDKRVLIKRVREQITSTRLQRLHELRKAAIAPILGSQLAR